MARRTRICAVFLSGLAALVLGTASSASAVAPITGTLNKPGYTVIALAASGEAATTVAADGAFSLVPPADTVTLHLRAPDGT